MIKRNPQKNKQQQSTRLRRGATYSLIFVCGLMLVSGFFFAGRQHFSSMDYGMKNSRLRKQINDLEAEKRRLLLAREVSLSPIEIKKAAKKVGYSDSLEPAPEIAKINSATKEKAVPITIATASPKPMIVKTAAVTSVPRPVTASYMKSDKGAKPEKRTAAAE